MLFAITPSGEEKSAAAMGMRRSFLAREIICQQGDTAECVYRLGHGVVMLYQILQDGRRQIVDVLDAGDYFGFGDGNVQDCFAETLTDCEITVWRIREAQSCPVWCEGFSRGVQRKLGAMHDHVTLLGKKTALERVSSMLMRLVRECAGRVCRGAPPSGYATRIHDLHMSRQEMADYLGLTLETVSRAISQLKRDGLIELPRPSQIVIKDPCRLCRLAVLH
ncbi:helix-turn-helix domain-containing protein [Rhizobium sp. EC-SD404]|uniref:Crp/Fnr family transcriptional regulator n=1 Tax=Rhizobium sp. EC-SD404 TaxID=2038389 RepID=UPI001255BF6F|nr:helix-turn-helix domain-containing protein [Rhizobium sp. EC-SD404]VVS96661.1 Transcriptional regulator, Crp/Fnr family protein [Rhizobium sp. EC-SD404]